MWTDRPAVLDNWSPAEEDLSGLGGPGEGGQGWKGQEGTGFQYKSSTLLGQVLLTELLCTILFEQKPPPLFKKIKKDIWFLFPEGICSRQGAKHL